MVWQKLYLWPFFDFCPWDLSVRLPEREIGDWPGPGPKLDNNNLWALNTVTSVWSLLFDTDTSIHTSWGAGGHSDRNGDKSISLKHIATTEFPVNLAFLNNSCEELQKLNLPLCRVRIDQAKSLVFQTTHYYSDCLFTFFMLQLWEIVTSCTALWLTSTLHGE